MKKFQWGFIISTLVVLTIGISTIKSQSPGRAYSAVPCGAIENNSNGHIFDNHVVFWSSEGTAWPNLYVYITMFNPTWKAQTIHIKLKPDNYIAVEKDIVIPPGERVAILANEWFYSLGMSGNINFSTEVKFETLGSAAMATWKGNGRDLTDVVYNPMTSACESPEWTSPYGI